MANSADPDQSPDLHCLQRQDISGFCRTRVNLNSEKDLFSRKGIGHTKNAECCKVKIFSSN